MPALPAPNGGGQTFGGFPASWSRTTSARTPGCWTCWTWSGGRWTALYPDRIEAILPVCGAAGCWLLNGVFLSGRRAAVEADPAFAAIAPGPGNAPQGLRASGQVYAGWAYSAAFWRDELWRGRGFSTREVVPDWWALVDLARACGAASLPEALGRVIAMPCDADRYFTLEENRLEAAAVRGAALRPIVSPYGHCAGAVPRADRAGRGRNAGLGRPRGMLTGRDAEALRFRARPL